jgi:hypothetical protein
VRGVVPKVAVRLRANKAELRARRLGTAPLGNTAGKPGEAAAFDRGSHRSGHAAWIVRFGYRGVDQYCIAAEFHRQRRI